MRISGRGKYAALKPLAGLYSARDGIVGRVQGLPKTGRYMEKRVDGDEEYMLFPEASGTILPAGHPMSDEEIGGMRCSPASGWIAALPDGIDTFVGGAGEGCPAGRRSVLPLPVLLPKRPCCPLDEATSALDGDTSDGRIVRT